MQRQTETLAKEIVQGRADGAPGGRVAVKSANELGVNRLEGKRIGSLDQRLELRQSRDDRRNGFSVITIRGRFTKPFEPIFIDNPHDDISMVRVAAPCYNERVNRLELDCLVRELHPAAMAGAARAVRAILNSLCADAVERKLIRASARSLPRSKR
jgi:hypothetical protein